MDALRPRLRELGIGLLRELRDPALELLDVPRDPAAPELDPGRGGSELGVGRRLDSFQRLEHRLADRLAELVPALEAVPARLAVAEPVVPARRCRRRSPGGRCTRLPARRPRPSRGAGPGSPCSRAASRRRSASDGRRSSRRRRSGSPSSRVHPKHRHAVVHRPLAADPVDADPGRAAGSPADARRPPPAPGRVDGSREQVGQRLHPRCERRRCRRARRPSSRARRSARCGCARRSRARPRAGSRSASARARARRRSCPRRRRRGRRRRSRPECCRRRGRAPARSSARGFPRRGRCGPTSSRAAGRRAG